MLSIGGKGVRGVKGVFFVQQLEVRGVLPTFETVVMYGHFDKSRATWYRQIVEIKPKFPVFYRGLKNGVM